MTLTGGPRETFLGVPWWGVLLASGGQRPGTLLDTPQPPPENSLVRCQQHRDRSMRQHEPPAPTPAAPGESAPRSSHVPVATTKLRNQCWGDTTISWPFRTPLSDAKGTGRHRSLQAPGDGGLLRMLAPRTAEARCRVDINSLWPLPSSPGNHRFTFRL